MDQEMHEARAKLRKKVFRTLKGTQLSNFDPHNLDDLLWLIKVSFSTRSYAQYSDDDLLPFVHEWLITEHKTDTT